MQAVSLEDRPRKAACSPREMLQAFGSRRGLHYLGGPRGSGWGANSEGELGREVEEAEKQAFIKPVTIMGKWSFIPLGTSGSRVDQASAILTTRKGAGAFIYQLPSAIGREGP